MRALELLEVMNRKGKIRFNNKGLLIGRCADLAEKYKKPGDFYLDYSDRAGHFGCFGTTRIGKTRLIESLVTQDILNGFNVVVIDPKGDIDLLSKIVQTSAEAGRLHELMFISPIYPDESTRIDPLAYYYMEDELVEHIISGIRAKDDYYINVASEISSVIVSGLIAMAKAKGNSPAINFYDIKLRSTHDSLKKFAESIQFLKDHPDSGIGDRVSEVLLSINQILERPVDFFAKVSSSLSSTLNALTSSTTGRIIGKASTNEFVKRFEKGDRVILICHTGSLLARRTAHIIGRVLVSMIQSTVGRFFASNRKIDPPLCLYIDEGHNILYKGIQELFNKAGGAGVWVHFITQSLAQIEEEVGREVTKSIMDNINHLVFMKVNHEETAQFVEDSTELKRVNQNYVHLDGGDLRISLKQMDQRLILKENVLKLKPRWFYMKSGSNMYKGYVPDVADPYVQLVFPKISVL